MSSPSRTTTEPAKKAVVVYTQYNFFTQLQQCFSTVSYKENDFDCIFFYKKPCSFYYGRNFQSGLYNKVELGSSNRHRGLKTSILYGFTILQKSTTRYLFIYFIHFSPKCCQYVYCPSVNYSKGQLIIVMNIDSVLKVIPDY